MKIISPEHFERMEMMSRNFGAKSKSNSLFLSEHEISKEINGMIRSIKKPTETEFKNIVELIKSIDNTEHYDGSQWYDYKIHLNAILRINGFELNII